MREKIAFIVPHLSGGGAERVVANLSKAISNDFEKFIIIYHDTEKQYENDGNVINLNIGPSNNILGKLLKVINRIRTVRKIKSQYKINKTISFMDNPNIVNILSKANENVIVSIRNNQSKEFRGIKHIIHRFLVKNLYTRANKIVAISQGVRQDLIENFGVNSDKIEVIYNPVDINRIKNLREESLDEKYQKIYINPTVITVGRLTYQKGQWHLIRAFKQVVEEMPNAQLIILGSGELKVSLQNLIDELNLSENIHLIGFQDNPFRYIYQSNLFILPSLFEGLGNVLLEAMACGTPVISTDCESGPREIIAPDTDINSRVSEISVEEFGILIPVPNGENLSIKHELTYEEVIMSKAILMLLKNKDLREQLKEKGLKRVNDFSFNNIAKKWTDL